MAGGCRNNRQSEQVVVLAGFEIALATRRARGTMGRFVARPAGR